MREVDGAVPDCEMPGKKCLIPPLDVEGYRIMEIYTTLRALHGLIEAGPILNIYAVDKDDIDFLVLIENEYKKAQPKNQQEH